MSRALPRPPSVAGSRAGESPARKPVATGDANRLLQQHATPAATWHGDREFDDLAALAASVAGMRWALLALVDEGGRGQPLPVAWSGLESPELAPVAALAADVAAHGDLVSLPDLRVDPRFSTSPAVTGPPGVHGFATVAVVTASGRRIGILCVGDPGEPELDDDQLARLQRIARQVSTLLTAPQLLEQLDRLGRAVRQVDHDQHAQMTLRSIDDGVVTVDPEGRVSYLNTLAEHLTGWPLTDAIGKRLSEVVAMKDEGGKRYRMPQMDRQGFSVDPLSARTVLVRRDGHEISIEGTFAPILADDRSLAGMVFAFRNVTVARRVAAELSHQAGHDPLTGLANRRTLERRIARLLKDVGPGVCHSLLYLDLDRFKAVNDTAGHLAGDELLRQLSALLKLQLRESDLLARLGGDEFGVLLEHCDPAHALAIAEKLRQTIEQFSFVWKDRAFDIGVSIGLVHIQDDATNLLEILSHADEACYVAKAEGRNRVHVYRAGEHERAQHRTEQQWVAEIKAALHDQRLFLCSQPIIRTRMTGNGEAHAGHIEVFIRMRARKGAVVPPMAFLPAAERFQLTPALDRWVVQAVLGHLVRSPEDRRLYSANLSAGSLLDASFVAWVRQQVADHGVDASRLCFEITEADAVANLTSAIAMIDELGEFGCRFAISGFGSGMSSFGYLKHLRVHYLKIDGALVQGITHDPVHRAMVESINRIGQLLGMQTIAEWVEDEAVLEAVRIIGVDYAQGYGVERPSTLGHDL